MSKRALRRHHRVRMIKRARHVTRRWHSTYEPDQTKWVRGEGRVLVPQGIDHSYADEVAARIADYLKICSCEHCGCGNPRRWRGSNGHVLTWPERISNLVLLEWEDEMD